MSSITKPLYSDLPNVNLLFEPISSCILDGDPGFDMDDYLAIALPILQNNSLKGVITSLYHPEEKKALTKAFITELYRGGKLPLTVEKITELTKNIFSGIGYYRSNPPEHFNELYPRWPSGIFGDVRAPSDDAKYKCIYPYQTKAFVDHGVPLEINSSGPELERFLAFLSAQPSPITFVTTGPTSNLAVLMRIAPDLCKEKIKSIVMMNGAFLEPARMGYNGGLNFKDTETVFNFGIPCLIVPSKLCENICLPKEQLIAWTKERNSLSAEGQLFLSIMENWEIHRARKKDPTADVSNLILNSPILADPLTMMIALDPSLIKTAKGVRYEFIHDRNDIHLLHKEAPNLIRIVDDPESNVLQVESLNNPDIVRQKLIDLLDHLLHDSGKGAFNFTSTNNGKEEAKFSDNSKKSGL